MFTPTGSCDGQISACELLKMVIDTCVFRVNKQLCFQFHYSCSVDSLVNMASNDYKHIKAVKLVK